MKIFDCSPAAAIDVTVYNIDIDFFERCTTDADGMCRVNAPSDPERELIVAPHLSTVTPGYAPADVINSTVHFSEFTGIGIPLFLETEVTPGTIDELPERTTLAVNMAKCDDNSSKLGCKRQPVKALVQASTGEITAENFPWLVTNDEGWVSFDRASLEGDTIDLMVETDTQPRFACTDLNSGDRIETEWIEGREGNFIRITPSSDDNITCDVTLLEAES